jgi:hypothetical protein
MVFIASQQHHDSILLFFFFFFFFLLLLEMPQETQGLVFLHVCAAGSVQVAMNVLYPCPMIWSSQSHGS